MPPHVDASRLPSKIFTIASWNIAHLRQQQKKKLPIPSPSLHGILPTYDNNKKKSGPSLHGIMTTMTTYKKKRADIKKKKKYYIPSPLLHGIVPIFPKRKEREK
jgi:hypothetical protein